MKRIDDQIFGGPVCLSTCCNPKQKVSWEVHALHPHTRAASHLDIHDPQRDRDARTAIEHLV